MASNKLQKKDYTRASLRAYFLQNGMNYSNYQGLGYANMLYPGLRKIYDDDDQLRDALKENVEFFNTNPSMVPFIGNLHLAMLDGGANAKEVKSFSNDTDAENEVYVADNTPVSEPVEEAKEAETVVIFPDSNDNASSQRFADDSNND